MFGSAGGASNATASFKPSGGAGSGPPGSGGMTILAKTCGVDDGPVAGQTTYSHPDLVGATKVNVIIVNEVPEVSIGAVPDFSFDTGTGEIDRDPNEWVDGDTLIVYYVPAP